MDDAVADAAPEPEPQQADPREAGPDEVAAAGPTIAAARPERDLDRGRVLFRQGCAICHGIKGDGKGPAARSMEPSPRDLTAAAFRFRSTAMGEAPLPEDLYRTIERGLTGTPMPGFSGMDPDDLWQVVFYVQSLSPAVADVERRVIPIPASLPVSPQTIARGLEVYRSAGCIACHGESGRGDGAAARKLADTAGHPIYAADLTRSSSFKRGDDPISLYRTISTGLNGTPMVGFESIPAEDRWSMVHWILDQ